jgi:hypothetical protein
MSDRSMTVGVSKDPAIYCIVVTVVWRVMIMSPPVFHSAPVWRDFRLMYVHLMLADEENGIR